MSAEPHHQDPERERVAATLERLRSGVRQRQAELATGAGAREEVRLRLRELRSHELLEHPPCFSPRPVVGQLLVLLRKAVFHLFMKWYLHPVVQQQNRYNQIASRLLEELAEENAELRRELARLGGRAPAGHEATRE